MEVTKMGITSSKWNKEVMCPRCEAHLKITWEDIFIRTTKKKTFFLYKRRFNYFIKCPECGCYIKLDKNKLPYLIKKEVIDNMGMVDRLFNFYFS